MSNFASSYRTHTCGELRAEHIGRVRTVALAGHVSEILDPRTFYLRDAFGRTLVTMADGAEDYVPEVTARIGLEDVVSVRGELVRRQDEDPALPTGEIFVSYNAIERLSVAERPPEGLLTAPEVAEDDKLLYRQLYLRRADMQERLSFRARLMHEIREYLIANDFLEIETPQLFWYDAVATEPEPVPVGDGKAFALPSGPLVLDQYIKPGGFDRFFQFVRITRREGNASPMHIQEYTGLDLNMAYVSREDFCRMVEGLLAHVARAMLGVDLRSPFPSFEYRDAMSRFGTDKLYARDDTGGEEPLRPAWVHSYPFLRPDQSGNFVPDVVVFSRVVEEDLKTALVDPEERNSVRAEAFDLIVNGVEIASAYMGNHNLFLQRYLWQHLYKLDLVDMIRLRAPIEAHRFGLAPHGGMNLGFDRLVAVLLGMDTLTECMYFPKSGECRDPMLGAPGPIPRDAVEELVADGKPQTFTQADYLKEVLES